jgi:hypothetical protein
MKEIIHRQLITSLLIGLCLATGTSIALAQNNSPKYKANIPKSILTPDKVDTQLLGTLEFFDGLPSKATVEKTHDFLDVARGVEAFLSGIPATSIYAAMEGWKAIGMEPGVLGLAPDLLDARSLFLTPNSTTVYGMMEINVKEGPMVVEMSPNVLGPVMDAFFRYVTDFGFVGPDQGKGGKYLFVHKSYEGDIPAGYFVIKTATYRNAAFFRAFVKDGDLAGAAKDIRDTFHMYPLAQEDNPPKQKFYNLSGKQFNTIHANDFHFYEELNEVVQYEPDDVFEPQLTGILASIGIKKGQTFAPDDRMKKLLAEAAAIGNATARSIVFDSRKKSVYYYPDRQWFASFAGAHDFMDNGEMVLDARTLWHYIATGVTPAMSTPKVGTGSVYPAAVRDSKGNYLDGAKTYSVTLPAPIPANNFWSFTAYDGQTRSLLETDQKLAGLDSNGKDVVANADGSYTIWFGPEAPSGKECNWVQTMPGKSYFVFLRLYGPLEPWFDKTWKPGDFELVK